MNNNKVTLEDMETIAEHISDDEILMIDITAKHKEICTIWYRRRVFMSETVYQMLQCAVADGFIYARVRRTEYEPYQRHGALYHMLKCSRQRVIKELGNHRALFRCSLRWDKQHYLFALATIRNQQQIMIVDVDELSRIE